MLLQIAQNRSMVQDKLIQVEVAVAYPEVQQIFSLMVPAGTTAQEVVSGADLVKVFPELNVATAPLGVWGKVVKPEYLLCDGDRVEVLRRLQIDPKKTRRELAENGGYMGSAGFDDT